MPEEICVLESPLGELRVVAYKPGWFNVSSNERETIKTYQGIDFHYLFAWAEHNKLGRWAIYTLLLNIEGEQTDILGYKYKKKRVISLSPKQKKAIRDELVNTLAVWQMNKLSFESVEEAGALADLLHLP